MKNAYLLITLLFCYPANGQNSADRHDKWLPFLNDVAQKMYPLVGGSEKCPTVIVGNTRELAVYVGGEDNRIAISPGVLDSLFVRLPENKAKTALAIIVGHEIWHCIQKQSGIGFGRSDGKERLPEAEKAADLHGLLAAQLIGHVDAIELFDDMMETLPLNEKTHVLLSQRKEQDSALMEKVGLDLQFFDIGAGFLLRGQDEDDFVLGRLCYQYVAQDLALLPELNFNLGLSYLLQALEACEFRYALPIEIAGANFAQNIIRRGPKGDDNNGKDVRWLLQQADLYFNKALAQKSNYDEAYLGHYCVQTMQQAGGNAAELKQWLEQYKKLASHQQYRKMQVLYAISLLRLGDPASQELAISQLKSVENGRSDLAANFANINLAKLDKLKYKSAAPPQALSWPSKDDEKSLGELDRSELWQRIDTRQGTLYYLKKGTKLLALKYDDRIIGIQDISPSEFPMRLLGPETTETGAGQYRHVPGVKTDTQTSASDFFFRVYEGRVLQCRRVFY